MACTALSPGFVHLKAARELWGVLCTARATPVPHWSVSLGKPLLPRQLSASQRAEAVSACLGSHQRKPLDFSQLPAAVSVAKPAWVSHCHRGAVVHEDSLAVLPPACATARASPACPLQGAGVASGANFQVRDLGWLGQGQPVPSLCSQCDRDRGSCRLSPL